MKKIQKEYLQSAIFGFNDALVSTTGVMVGISAGTGDKRVVILAGIVTILVEALSMGSGQYLSAKSASQLDKSESTKMPIISGLIMLGSYFVAGLVPLVAIILSPIEYAMASAAISALTCLVVLGYVKGKIVKVSPLKSAVEVLIIGGVATAIGIIAGKIFAI